jgi:hypothetical protein
MVRKRCIFFLSAVKEGKSFRIWNFPRFHRAMRERLGTLLALLALTAAS